MEVEKIDGIIHDMEVYRKVMLLNRLIVALELPLEWPLLPLPAEHMGPVIDAEFHVLGDESMQHCMIDGEKVDGSHLLIQKRSGGTYELADVREKEPA